MKKTLLFAAMLLLCTVGFAVMGRKATKTSPAKEPREIREQRRAARQAALERNIDSIVMARAFQFSPQSMQQEPAGSMRMLQNPNFEVGIWDGAADIFLPYIKGIVPPYRTTLINYTVTMLNNYLSVQTDEGWRVSFETSLYSASTYKFTFEINAKFGTTTLNISNAWYNTVQYTGTISQYY